MFQLSFSTLLFTAFLRSLPEELEESARMDGASTWGTFWRIVFPLMAHCAHFSAHAALGCTSFSIRFAFSISARRRSYAACRFSHERASPPK